MNKLNNPYFWAKVAAICGSMLDYVGDDGKVWLSDDDKEVFKVLGGLSGEDMIRCAIGFNEN